MIPSTSRVHPLLLDGPAGALESTLREPDRVLGAAVVAHPHPLFGGTMHTKVVSRASRLLADRLKLLTLRFNFRGVGASAGVHDNGRGEVDDLVAAARFGRGRNPEGPFVLGGFSFGSMCAVGAAPMVMPDVLFLLGLPLRRYQVLGLAELPDVPVVLIQGEKDEFGGAEDVGPLAERWDWILRIVPGADHFFTGDLDRFESAALSGLNEAIGRLG